MVSVNSGRLLSSLLLLFEATPLTVAAGALALASASVAFDGFRAS